MLGNRLQSGSAHPIGSEILTIQPNRRVPIVWAVELAALISTTMLPMFEAAGSCSAEGILTISRHISW
jgi:hypothetical protein